MRRISSRTTFWYKRIFPVIWFGMLGLFVTLAGEWVAVELLRTRDQARPSSFATNLLSQLPRFTGIATALILASGIALDARFGRRFADEFPG